MRYSRIIGYNINKIIKQKNIKKSEFASNLNYSDSDVNRIIEGRLVLTPQDLFDIAEKLNVSIEDLIKDKKYSGCMKKFINKDYREKILDIIDMYIDLKEAIEITKHEGG